MVLGGEKTKPIKANSSVVDGKMGKIAVKREQIMGRVGFEPT